MFLTLSGCASGTETPDASDAIETSGTAETTNQEIRMTASTTTTSEQEFVEEDPSYAVVYQGITYYGLVSGDWEPIMPEDAVYLGTTAASSVPMDGVSISEVTNVPTAELQTNWSDPNMEIYATFDGDTIEAFYSTGTSYNNTTYLVLESVSTEKPIIREHTDTGFYAF